MDGYWKHEPTLFSKLNISEQLYQKYQPVCLFGQNDVYATLLVLMWLEWNFSNIEQNWELVAQKGKLWLQQKGFSYEKLKAMIDYNIFSKG